MGSVDTLYTSEVLALATALADWPLCEDLPLRGSARSVRCGSALILGLEYTDARVTRVGVSASACAIGQASAALFVRAVCGRTRDDIVHAEAAIANWLTTSIAEREAPLPDWPGLEVIARAAAYPARHGAILLGWRAALAALNQGERN